MKRWTRFGAAVGGWAVTVPADGIMLLSPSFLHLVLPRPSPCPHRNKDIGADQRDNSLFQTCSDNIIDLFSGGYLSWIITHLSIITVTLERLKSAAGKCPEVLAKKGKLVYTSSMNR